MKASLLRVFPIFATALLLFACSSLPTPEERIDTATDLARQQGWYPISLRAGLFNLSGFVSPTSASHYRLKVYIEGDGLAWISRSRPSANPTPINPVGLKLALADPAEGVVYLGRPCQFSTDVHCPVRYWLEQRFGWDVIHAYDQALDQLKARYGGESLTLIGYSGGGAIATLLAARRQDVDLLITVAGNLDTDYWTRHHKVSPLVGSLNPANDTAQLEGVPQWHFIGDQDVIIPPVMIRQFISRFPQSTRPALVVVPGYDHHCCWVDGWPELIGQTRQ